MKKKILRVITRLNIGGPAIQAIDLSCQLKAYGYETFLVHGELDVGEKEINKTCELTEQCISSIFIPTLKREINIKNDFASFLNLRRIIKKENPDIIHSHMTKAGLIARFAVLTLWNKPKVVHTFHGTVFESYFGWFKNKIVRCVERYLAKKSDVLIAVSDKQKDDICNKYKIIKEDKVKVINLGFDLSQIDKRLGFCSEDFNDIGFIFGIVGRIAKIKNHELFIGLMKLFEIKLGEKGYNCVGLIIGDGEEKIKHNLLPLISKNILFCGYIDYTKLNPLYSSLDIVFCTSHNEGTPVALIKAMAAKVLVASTRVGGVEDLLGSSNCERRGFYIDPENIENSVDRIIECLLDEKEYNEVTEKAYEYVQHTHNLKRLLTKMDTLYKELFQG